MKRTGEINESLLTEKKADQKLPYGSLRENLQEEPKLYLDDEPKANNYVVFDPEQECTSTQIISHIGFGKSQVVMMTVLFFAWFAEHSEINLMPILSTRLYVEMDLTPELESALGAASFAGFAVSYPLWGIIADKIGRRPTLILSHCWILFWGILCCLAPSLTWLIVFRVMYSLAGGIMNILIPYYYEYLAPQYRHIGFVTGNGLGSAFGNTFPVITALIILTNQKDGTWRWYLFLNTLPFFILIPLAFLLLEESPRYLINKGRKDEALSVLRRLAKMNGRQLPEDLQLKPEPESGDSDDTEPFLTKLKIALKDEAILRTFLCIISIGIASRYVTYGMTFVKTELLFKNGQSESYCSTDRERTYYLETKDYLNLLYSQAGEFVAAFLIYPVLKYQVSLRISQTLGYGLAIILTAFLYFCPTLGVALFVVTLERTIITVCTVVMWLGFSGLLPTKVRSSLFGLGSFIMYLILPFTPYLIQTLSKESMHLVTTASIVILSFGVIGGILTPSKIYSN